jgi:hypothetical protein
MDTKDSLPCSQRPAATGPYPQPAESNPCLSFQFYPSIIQLDLQNSLFPSDFLTKILYSFLFPANHATYTTHVILSDP